MKTKLLFVGFASLMVFNSMAVRAESNNKEAISIYERIEEIAGAKGKYDEKEDVFKVSFPRTDVPVFIDGRRFDSFMGLTSWTSFTKDPKGGMMVMGDLVLFQDEVNPVMSEALDNGLEVTALHNHFFYDEPKVYFMHVGGTGEAEALALAVKKSLDKVKEIRAKSPQPATTFGSAPSPDENSITPSIIENILGVKGEAKNGMFKVVIGRQTKMPCGCVVGKNMGVNTWAAFAGSDEKAVVDGDFAMLESELQPVLKVLRKHGINIVAIHNHMTMENPRMIFLHYWGIGTTTNLSPGVKAALDIQQSEKASGKPTRYQLNFDDAAPGKTLAGWKSDSSTAHANWQVVEDQAAPSKLHVLKLIKPSSEFNLFWTDGTRFHNGTLQAKIKANSGEIDQGGGLIWRVLDERNYYLARYNPLERNFRLYYVKNGQREMLKSADADIPSGEWFKVKIEHHVKSIRCYLNDVLLIEANDSTFLDEGGIGFWTKADAASSFDDLTIQT